jgi:hypothetical protein
MTIVRRSSRPLLTYAAGVAVAFLGTWGVTASEARWTSSPARDEPVPTVRAGAVIVQAEDPPPSPDSLAALLIDPSRPARGSRGRTAMLRDVVAMTDQMWSGSERAAVLEEVAAIGALDSSIVTAIAHASTRIASSSDRAEVLEKLIRHHPPAVGASRRAVLEAIASMSSTSTRASALTTFVSRPRLGQAALIDALAQVARLPSSERAYVLRSAARANRIEGRARTIYVQAAMSLTSRSQRSRALSAIGARYGSNEND